MLSRQNCSWFTTKWTSHPAWSLNPGDERVVHGQSAAGSEHEDLGEQEEEQGGGEQQHGWTTSGEGGVADTLVSVWAFWRKVGRQNISSFKGSTYINLADPRGFCGNCCCGSFFANCKLALRTNVFVNCRCRKYFLNSCCSQFLQIAVSIFANCRINFCKLSHQFFYPQMVIIVFLGSSEWSE